MSQALLLMGESGSGKTTSMRNLPPEETYYIDCDKKGLSWRGWRKQYNAERKNYVCSDDADAILNVIQKINEQRPNIHYIIIDTINGIMVSDEIRRMHERGYDKWQDLVTCIWGLIDGMYEYRDDLTLIFLGHTQTDRDDSGYTWTRLKTSGKKLDKICLESRFTTVIQSKVIDGQYKFELNANNSTVKTPMGMFDTSTIDNDIMLVINAMKDF